MNRCIDCDGLLMKEETVCQICGAAVPQAHKKMDAGKVITQAVQGLFVLSIAAAVMGLFSDIGPGFVPSILLCSALMIVARSLRDRPESVPSAKRK